MLLAGALLRRSASAVVALLLPVVVWLNLFGGLLIDKSHPGGDLTVASHNVGADNPDPVGTARDLAASGADVLALEEMTEQARGTYEKELAQTYPYHTVQGTVGLWSKLPLSDTQPRRHQGRTLGPLTATPVDTDGLPNRALRITVATDHGPLAVYVAHLGSVRVNPRAGFWTDQRDTGAQALGKAIAAEQNERVVLLGDLNGTMDDRAFDGITSQLRSAQDAAGDGFGFSWPAKFPVVRIDQILVRGVEPESSWVAAGHRQRPPAGGGRQSAGERGGHQSRDGIGDWGLARSELDDRATQAGLAESRFDERCDVVAGHIAVLDSGPGSDKAGTWSVQESPGTDDEPVEIRPRQVDVGGLLDLHVVLETRAARPATRSIREHRNEDEPPNSGERCRVGGFLQASAIDQRRLVHSGAMGAGREDHGIMAAHLLGEVVNRVCDEVTDHRSPPSCPYGLALSRPSVHAGHRVPARGEELSEAAADSSSSADLKHLHSRLPFSWRRQDARLCSVCEHL